MKFPKKRTMIILVSAISIYMLVGVILYFVQNYITFPTPQNSFESCEAFDGAEVIQYAGDEQSTRMYHGKNESDTVVVFYHGNADDVCAKSFLVKIFDEAGVDYIFPEYIGYGRDGNRPSDTGIKNDVNNVARYIEENNYDHDIVIGQSLGTGAASYHAKKAQPEKLLLISPFKSLKEISLRFAFIYPQWLVRNQFDNIKNLSEYDGNVTIIHGNRDLAVPFAHGKEVFDSLSQTDKSFITIEGGGHANIFDSGEVEDIIAIFLENN